MITIGLDFGTHQSKVCIEQKEGAELSYEFFMFKDADGKEQFTLPSIIHVNSNGHMTYGYLPNKLKRGKIIRYFKQATFTSVANFPQTEAVNYSIWYIAYILFDLEERFGQDFAIQMGVPSDGMSHRSRQELAVRILLSAYRLVEEVFENDKEAFLNATLKELLQVTKLLSYSNAKKEEFGLLVFPEAYACLMPLVKSQKIATGMSLMVDIGGGTTDISFFTIEKEKPQVYRFKSINKGLNYLTDADAKNDTRHDSNVKADSEINANRQSAFTSDLNQICINLREDLKKEFKKQSELPIQRLTDALSARPLVYSGGGSTFGKLRQPHLGFRDIIHISEKEWNSVAIKDMDIIRSRNLCPILSTAYGLSISVTDDKIRCKSFRDIFDEVRKWTVEKKPKKYVYGGSISSDGFDYGIDWDALK